MVFELRTEQKQHFCHSFSRAENAPDVMTKLRVVASDPVGCAKFFNLFLCAFCDVFLGYPIGAKEQKFLDGKPCGLFGRVLAYMFKFESSGRGGIHAHGVIIQPDLQATRLQAITTDPLTKAKLLNFLEHTMSQVIPTTLDADGLTANAAALNKVAQATIPPLQAQDG